MDNRTNKAILDIELLESVYNSLRALFFVCDSDGVILEINNSGIKYLKTRKENLIGTLLYDLVIEEDRDKLRLLAEEKESDERYWEINFICSDGSMLLLNCYKMIHEDYTIIVGRFNDSSVLELQEKLMLINNEMTNLNRELERKKRQLEVKNRLLEEQRNEIMEKNASIAKQLALAKKIQEHFVKTGSANLYNLVFKSDYAPAYEIGGDYFDIIDLKKGKVGVFISDVSGHGISAALVMTVVRTIFQKMQLHYDNPSELLEAMNQEMNHIFGSYGENFDVLFCTAFYCVIDTNTMTLEYCSAGHPGAWLIRDDEKTDLDKPAFPLGIFKKADYENASVEYHPEDKLVFFTDGFTDYVMNYSFQNVEHRSLLEILKQSGLADHLPKIEKMKDDVSLIVVELDDTK